MSVESWKSVFDIGTVVALFLAFAFGFGVWYTSAVVNDRQAEKLRQFTRDLASANAKAEEFRAEVAKANNSAAQAQERAAALELKAEVERSERMKLEEELAPRLFKSQEKAIERLKTFKGTRVRLEYSLDLECKRTAEQIAYVLHEAEWSITPRPNTDPNPVFFEGIVVGGLTGSGGVGAVETPETEHLVKKLFNNRVDVPPSQRSPGTVLLEQLNETGLDAHTVPGTIAAPIEAVYVYVGFKPSPEDRRNRRQFDTVQKKTFEAFASRKPLDLTELKALQGARRPGTNGARMQLPTH